MIQNKELLSWKRLRSSVWTFPLLLLIPLLLLTALQIHGSSIGSYYPVVEGNRNDPDLLFGTPKPIRSDEWLTVAQLIVLQTKTGFPSFNEALGTGRDLAIQPEIPFYDWSTIFKPHNWSFFVMPVEYAFAFKWWFLMYLLVVSVYFFILRILPKHKFFAILMSLGFGISPFILWWYQTAVFVPLTVGFLMMILGMRIINSEPIPFIKSQRWRDVVYTVALAYLCVWLALIIYPPFIVPVLITVFAFMAGYSLQQKSTLRLTWKKLLLRFLPFGIAGLTAGLITLLFLLDHKEMVEIISNTAYPGQRLTPSGDLPILSVFDAHLMPLTQSAFRGSNFFTNQSEASNFILLLPFMIVPGLFLQVREYIKARRIDWVFLCLQLCALLFFARVFLPIGDDIYRLLLLDRVPNIRLVIGFGFLGFIHLIWLVKKIGEAKLSPRQQMLLATMYGGICFAILYLIGKDVMNRFPNFLSSMPLMIGLALAFTSIIVLFLLGKRTLAAIAFLLFSAGSSFYILPTYRGLDFITDGKLVTSIARVSGPNDDWVTIDAIYYENLPLAAGRGNFGGAQLYPDTKFWEQVGGAQYEKIYNRQAHAIFALSTTDDAPLELVQPNLFKVRFVCSDFIVDNIEYALAVGQVDLPCLTLAEKVNYPNATFYLYKINKQQ